ncbi:MAG: hypothetical protein IV084_09340, partial [Rugosibacter sp.]|nr:hypothetical protein [Rugosibacter sp.]
KVGCGDTATIEEIIHAAMEFLVMLAAAPKGTCYAASGQRRLFKAVPKSFGFDCLFMTRATEAID